jgi:hypothetical protein
MQVKGWMTRWELDFPPGFNANEAEHWLISKMFSPFLAGGIVMSEYFLTTNVLGRLKDLHENWYEHYALEVKPPYIFSCLPSVIL